ncbi:hypothetical protein FRZ44_38200 [Hypericibacter terrae]|uniref:Uncharacterized protein n=1 Tax=Hypericibacter terrae TaxID=2602015 RepID=A0A5J6MMB3_9PROT|nr:hypothetical protein [Hypericibacter terrae]QEX18513.1 hypothetical protein FRZ44_38200 [Hypericibacter terrae]
MSDLDLDDSDLAEPPVDIAAYASDKIDRAFVAGAGAHGLTREAYEAAMRAHEHPAALARLRAALGEGYRFRNGVYPGLGRYRAERGGCWEPVTDREDGALCITVPLLCWEAGRALRAWDMLLIDAEDPAQVAIRGGPLSMLGVHFDPWHRTPDDAPWRVRLCPTPIDWLAQGGSPLDWGLGMPRQALWPVWVMDWEHPDAQALLLHCSLVCADEAQGLEIARRQKAAARARHAAHCPPAPVIEIVDHAEAA